MAQIFKNNVWGQLASELASGATTATLNAGHGFTDPGTDWYLATLIGVTGTTETSWEIVKVTDVSTNTLTIVRAQEGTTAVTWPVGTRIELRLTAGATESKANLGTAAYKAAPSGDVVGTTDTQTLTNKTISADNNTLSGIAASSFVLSNASGNIDGSAAQKAIPSGVVVGTTDTQTLTNKTLTNPTINGFTGDTSVINIGSGQIYKATDGKVGIGTSSPSYDLQVQGVANYAYFEPLANSYGWVAGSTARTNVDGLRNAIMGQSVSGGTSNLILQGEAPYGVIDKGTGAAIKIDGTSNSNTGAIHFYTGTGVPSERMTLDSSGNFTIGTLAGTGNRAVYSDSTGKLTNSSSDARLKESITPLTTCLNKTLELKPVSYQWRDKANLGSQTEIGFIAQDMETVVPEVIGSNSDGMKSIDYPKLVALLTGAIQEQQALIEQLNLRIAALEGA